jgi:tRNA threonylcarbamoyladenosine biosynthesis protein TsaB
MARLFIDSCEYLTLGLLGEDSKWIDYEQFSTVKNSEIVHGKLFEMLKRNGLKLKDVTQVFQAAGPGSYTGMRLSDGICQILLWQGAKVNSFYHFEVPMLLGETSYIWISEAFKGEIYCHQVLNGTVEEKLLPKDGRENQSFVEQFYGGFDHVFTHYPTGAFESEYTCELIRKSSVELFEKIKSDDLVRETFYYRPLDKEFKQTQRP